MFDVLTDHRAYSRFTPLRRSILERTGEPSPNGVGAVRVLSVVGPPLREEVTAYEPRRLFAYRLLSGLPVRDHTGEVELSESPGGTSVRYRVVSETKLPVPDALWGQMVRPAIKQLLDGIQKESERRARAAAGGAAAASAA